MGLDWGAINESSRRWAMYREWLRRELAKFNIELRACEPASSGEKGQDFKRYSAVTVRLPSGSYTTVHVALREHQDSTSEDTAEDVAARFAAFAKSKGWM